MQVLKKKEKGFPLGLLDSKGSKTAQLDRAGNRPLYFCHIRWPPPLENISHLTVSLPVGVCLKLKPRNGSPLRGPQISLYSLPPSLDPQGFAVPN